MVSWLEELDQREAAMREQMERPLRRSCPHPPRRQQATLLAMVEASTSTTVSAGSADSTGTFSTNRDSSSSRCGRISFLGQNCRPDSARAGRFRATACCNGEVRGFEGLAPWVMRTVVKFMSVSLTRPLGSAA